MAMDWVPKEMEKKGDKSMKKPVRIEKNSDGTYSAYIYACQICRGTYEKCVEYIRYSHEYID